MVSHTSVALPLPFFCASASNLLSFHNSLKLHPYPLSNLLLRRRRSLKSSAACGSASASQRSSCEETSRLQQWDAMTAQFAGASNIPFLLIQIPQILLNHRNLVSGNSSALLAVPWLGMLTGLLGNLTLLSYFAKKKEKEAILVQTLGVVSIYVVIAQLAVAGAMSPPLFVATSTAVVAGLVLNFMNYYGMLIDWVWQIWEDFITIVGLSVLPQVMCSTFVPFIPNSILPGVISCTLSVAIIILLCQLPSLVLLKSSHLLGPPGSGSRWSQLVGVAGFGGSKPERMTGKRRDRRSTMSEDMGSMIDGIGRATSDCVERDGIGERRATG